MSYNKRILSDLYEEHLQQCFALYKTYSRLSNIDKLRCDYFSKQATYFFNLYNEYMKMLLYERKRNEDYFTKDNYRNAWLQLKESSKRRKEEYIDQLIKDNNF